MDEVTDLQEGLLIVALPFTLQMCVIMLSCTFQTRAKVNLAYGWVKWPKNYHNNFWYFHDDINKDKYYAMKIIFRDKGTWPHMGTVCKYTDAGKPWGTNVLAHTFKQRALVHELQCCIFALCFRALFENSTCIYFAFFLAFWVCFPYAFFFLLLTLG